MEGKSLFGTVESYGKMFLKLITMEDSMLKKQKQFF